MDYPKSVAGVGLIDGKFVDENQVTGEQGSLIPAAWGNAVTEELLAVIQASGLAPTEGQNDQLLAAVRTIAGAASRTVSASAALSATQLGLVLVDAAAGVVTITLPTAAEGLRVVLRRVDVTANAVVIAAAAADKLILDATAQAAGQATTELLFAGDYLALQADAVGRWWCVGQAQLPGSIASGLVSYSSAGAHTFTVPAVLRSGRRVPEITVCGGGGAGARNDSDSGSGGGGGGAAIKRVSLAGVSSVPVTVGAGGIPAGSGVTAGSGGVSSFGAYCSATGGEGAIGAGAGAGGAGTGGDINIEGQGGSAKANGIGTGVYASGAGGSSLFAGGGRGRTTSAAQPGLSGGIGGGGSGSIMTGAGGIGGVGIVLVRW